MSSWKESANKRREAKQSSPDDRQPKHLKTGKRKTFIIEARGKEGTLLCFRDWGVWNRYASEKSRDEALAALQGRDDKYFEYRAGV